MVIPRPYAVSDMPKVEARESSQRSFHFSYDGKEGKSGAVRIFDSNRDKEKTTVRSSY